MAAADSLLFSDLPDAPDFSIENKLLSEGRSAIAGVDEVGRGPLAGPVVAAAVILDPDCIPVGLNDSKKLTEKTREAIFLQILATSHVAWASLPANIIDETNIRAAALRAMTLSVERLPAPADAALIDGKDVPEGLIHIGKAFVKGDARSVSIAAASIIAKVVRDRMMKEADRHFPAFGFAGHKGYGSKAHREAIEACGPCLLHRKSFSPIKQMLER
ncbi:MAG: ribonuclease HII [Rhizobiaceae bacterium]|nr:ribonuclease HII [Rhizobiaceae bacterium]